MSLNGKIEYGLRKTKALTFNFVLAMSIKLINFNFVLAMNA